jgi:phospholipid/cholesterol/gamma-HCH transport system permease protein
MKCGKAIPPGSHVRSDFIKVGDGRFILKVTGQLGADTVPRLWQELPHRLAALPIRSLEVDATDLTHCDSAGLGLLYYLNTGQMTPGVPVTLKGLKPELHEIFQAFSMADYEDFLNRRPTRQPVVEEVGTAVKRVVADLKEIVVFIGEISSGLVVLLLHPRQIRTREVLRVFENAGVNALPIVSLISFLVGLIIAFEAAQPLAQFGAQIYIANMIGLIMVRELGPVMAAILLAGRSGSAFAAELGSMKVDEELNALETMGLDPVRFLVLQRIIASLLLTPLLTIYAMFTGVVGGLLVMVGLGFPTPMVLNQLESSVRIKDIMFGTSKGFVFGLIVAGIACLRGLQTKAGASAVGESATRSVVSGIVLIVIIDTIFAAVTFVLKK